MKRTRQLSPLKTLARLSAVVAIILLSMSIDWYRPDFQSALALSGVSTGWCTDHSGRNFRCGSGGSSSSSRSSGGGGGCASMIQQQQNANAEAKRSAASMVASGNALYQKGDYAWAATSYDIAVNQDPTNITAKKNLGTALNKLGVEASGRGDKVSALMYYQRANATYKRELFKDNIASAKSQISSNGRLNCSLCGRALINDVGYGIDTTQSFSSYVSQAISNFENCKRRVGSSCRGTKGQGFKDVVLSCSNLFITKSENAYKVCTRQAHADAIR
jgi:tetratricopeptide (TPR) repeat protein